MPAPPRGPGHTRPGHQPSRDQEPPRLTARPPGTQHPQLNYKFTCRWIAANIARAANKQAALVYAEILNLAKSEVETAGYSASLLFGGDGYSGRKSKGAARIEDTSATIRRVERLEKDFAKSRRDSSPGRRRSPDRRSPDRRRSPPRETSRRRKKKKASDLASPTRSRDEKKASEELCPKFNRGECSRQNCKLGLHRCSKKVSDPRGGLKPCGKNHPGVDHR